MSHDPAETDETDRQPEPKDIGHDEWPLKGYDRSGHGPAYLGIMNPGDEATERAVFYDDRKETVFQADVDQEQQQYVPREGSERDLEPTDTLGEVLEDIGEGLEWDSLSAFARERLQDDEADAATESETDPTADPAGPGLGSVTFTQSNVAATADHDLEFSGSYQRRTDDGRELTVERTFEVAFDDPDDPRAATIDVNEHVIRTDDAGQPDGTDADRLAERETTFEVDLEAAADDRQLEARIEDRCEDWHTTHVEPPM